MNRCFTLGTVKTISAKPAYVCMRQEKNPLLSVFNFLFIKEPDTHRAVARWPEKLSLLVSSHQMKILSLKKR